jgi:recombination protein RecT
MANKTVLKLLLARFAPLSVKMQQAVIADQAVINDPETHDVTYADNEDVVIDKEKERVRLLIEDADDEESLTAIIDSMGDSLTIEHFEMIEQKRIVITSKK